MVWIGQLDQLINNGMGRSTTSGMDQLTNDVMDQPDNTGTDRPTNNSNLTNNGMDQLIIWISSLTMV